VAWCGWFLLVAPSGVAAMGAGRVLGVGRAVGAVGGRVWAATADSARRPKAADERNARGRSEMEIGSILSVGRVLGQEDSFTGTEYSGVGV